MSTINIDKLYSAIGERIHKYREMRGYTQEQLATLISLTRTSVTNIEHGKQKILLHTLYDIALALQTETQELLPDINLLKQDQDTDEKFLEGFSKEELIWFNDLLLKSKEEG